jgi:hypothetical protein
VSDGVTLTAVPLVAGRFPGVITPVPPLKTPVRLAVAPAAIDAGLAAKLVIAGAATTTGFTVTVAVCCAVAPAELVTVKV